jgi:hypothetical protein
MKRSKMVLMCMLLTGVVASMNAGHAGLLRKGVTGQGTLTGVLANGGFLVEYVCQARAEGGLAAATRINACYLADSAGRHIGQAASPKATSGNVAITTQRTVVQVVPKVCWNVSTVFTDNKTAVAGGCAGPLSLGGGALPKVGNGSSFGSAS